MVHKIVNDTVIHFKPISSRISILSLQILFKHHDNKVWFEISMYDEYIEQIEEKHPKHTKSLEY